MAEGLSISLPLSLDEKDGPYKSNMTLDEVAQQNIKMIVLTSARAKELWSQTLE